MLTLLTLLILSFVGSNVEKKTVEMKEEVSGMATHSTDTSAQLDDQLTADQGTVKFLNFQMP